MDWPFFLCLVALVAVAVHLRDKRMGGTAAILLVNWALCTAFVAATAPDVPTWASKYPWPVFAMFDYAAGFSILLLLRQYGTISMWQIAVGVLYVIELVCHASVGAKVIANVNADWAMYRGLDYLSWAAWAQVAIVGAWGGIELAGRYRMPDRGLSARVARFRRDRVSGPHGPRKAR